MPTKFPLKLMTQGPIASRTRLKLGAPIYKNRAIQYPDSWPLLQKAIIYSKLQALENQRKHRRGSVEKKGSFTLSRSKQLLKLNQHASRLEPVRKGIWQKAVVGNKCRSSFVDFATCKPIQDNAFSERKTGKGQMRSKNYRLGSRKNCIKRKGRKAKRRSGKQKIRKGKSRSKKKKISRKQRKRRRRRLSRTRKGQRRRMEHYEERSRRTVEVPPPCGHAQDGMLKQRNDVNKEWFDTVKDEVKEDPLNISDLCRRLVKGLPGTPADCREDFDEKSTKPDPQRDLQISEAGGAGSLQSLSSVSEAIKETKNVKNEDLSRTVARRSCVKELRALLNDQESRKYNHKDILCCKRSSTQKFKRTKSADLNKESSNGNYYSEDKNLSLNPKGKTDIVQVTPEQTVAAKHRQDIIVDSLENNDRCFSPTAQEKNKKRVQKKTTPTKDRPSSLEDTKGYKQNEVVGSSDVQQNIETETRTITRWEANLPPKHQGRSRGHKRRVNGMIVDSLENNDCFHSPTAQEKNKKRISKKTSSTKDRPSSPEDTEGYKQNEVVGSSDVQQNIQTETRTITRWEANLPLKHPGRNRGHKRQLSGMKGRIQARKIDRLKRKHRKMRREYIKLMKMPRLRLKLLARNAFCKKRRPKAKKRNEMRKRSTRHQPMSLNHTKKTSCPRRGSTSYPNSGSRRSNDGIGNVNNNVNNNQTETGIWCRVSGRLLRVGRYLLRKFHLFFW